MGKQKIYKRLVLGTLGFTVGGLGLIALACPSTDHVYADDLTTTKEAQTVTQVLVRPVLAVALSPVVTIDLAPKSSGAYSSSVAELKVATNSRNGFAVLMNGVNGTDLSPVHGEKGKISSISKASTLANFPANTWGYYIGEQAPTESSQFSAIPAVSTEIKSTTTSTDNQTYKVAFGTKIDTNLEVGLYSNEVVISVVANPVEVRGLQDLYYMQDITPEICAATTELEVSKELVDIRDDKTYKVAKLKDGNCWMQENLALNLTTKMTLTPADSDVANNWTPTENTQNAAPDNTAQPNATASYHPNAYWYYQFNAATAGTGNVAFANGQGEASGSICPKGWKLPYADSNNSKSGSFAKLFSSYGITSGKDAKIKQLPLNFVMAGGFVHGLEMVNVRGYYWSRNIVLPVDNLRSTKYLDIRTDSGLLLTSTTNPANCAFSVRCVTISK